MSFMSEDDTDIVLAAEEYARKHRSRIAREVVDLSIYPQEDSPWTVFMAGSPGAGKTEVSKAFAALLEELPAQGFDGLGKDCVLTLMIIALTSQVIREVILGCSTRRSPELLKACSIEHSN
jgi:putative protein kinase ArgK-like GTPase of G3E family